MPRSEGVRVLGVRDFRVIMVEQRDFAETGMAFTTPKVNGKVDSTETGIAFTAPCVNERVERLRSTKQGNQGFRPYPRKDLSLI